MTYKGEAKQKMKRTVSLILVIALIFTAMTALSSCGKSECSIKNLSAEYTRKYEGTTLNVFNWGEYISDGEDGSLDVNAEFEALTGIKVNYTNYDSNEAMYAKMKSGAVSYDIIIPSDYMIQRLISENMVQKIDMSKITNYGNISDEYKGLYFDPNNEYSVPFNVGMVGLIYNKTMVKEAPTSWSVMWDANYMENILTFNNSRDAFAIAQFLMGIDVNTEDPCDWDAAAEKLKEQNEVLQGKVMDQVFDKMEGGNAAIAPYYAGDFLTMKENNDDLEFVYPEEGTNIFVDSICIPSSAKNYEQALMYINFLLEPEVALANAEYLCYATPNTAVLNNEDYSLKDNEILYPAEDKKPKTEYFHDLSPDIRSYYEKLWEDVLR